MATWDNMNDDIFLPKPERYYMHNYDKNSIKEIKRLIEEGKYKDKYTVKQHLKFLEVLAEKLRMKINEEKRVGNISWSLERDFAEIKEVFSELNKILENM